MSSKNLMNNYDNHRLLWGTRSNNHNNLTCVKNSFQQSWQSFLFQKLVQQSWQSLLWTKLVFPQSQQSTLWTKLVFANLFDRFCHQYSTFSVGGNLSATSTLYSTDFGYDAPSIWATEFCHKEGSCQLFKLGYWDLSRGRVLITLQFGALNFSKDSWSILTNFRCSQIQ